MEFRTNRIFFAGVAVGMVLVFLFAQPFVLRGIVEFKGYIYAVLPEAVSSFLWSQTLGAITFFWFMIFVGFGIWAIRGDFFAHEFPDDDSSDPPDVGSPGRGFNDFE